MKFSEFVNESKDDKLLDNLRLWYNKYSKLISGFSKQLKSYYIKVDNPYEDFFFNRLNSHYDLCKFAEFVVKYCFLHNGKMVRPHNAPHTPTDVLRIANGLEVNFELDTCPVCGFQGFINTNICPSCGLKILTTLRRQNEIR